MKSRGILFVILLSGLFATGCSMVGLDLQKDYDYHPETLDPHINISARKFLEDRANGTGVANGPADTVFKWMLKGLEYAGIDLAEYEKTGRTFIFLNNESVRVRNATTGAITGGLWFDFPVVTGVNPTTGLPITKIATQWSDYPVEDVRNYFLYLIGQGEYSFHNLNIQNTAVQSMLPAGAVLSKNTMLGYANEGKGFDEEGKFYLKILNSSDQAPIVHNDRSNDRSAGYIATNGIVHVFQATIAPSLPDQ